MRRFFVDTIPVGESSFVITGPEAKHLSRVLRMEPGERVVLLDGQGARFQAAIKEIRLRHVVVDLEKPLPSPAPSPVDITLCQAVLKPPRMDLLVEKTAELGVNRILPFVSARSVVRVDADKARSKVRHWQDIGRSASKQSDRAVPPQIGQISGYEQMLAALCKEPPLKIMLWEREGIKNLKDVLRSTSRTPTVFAVIGPEGGFTEEEEAQAAQAGFIPVSLGSRILRAETAGISLVTIVQYEWGDLGKTA